jgi:hypothetical protein
MTHPILTAYERKALQVIRDHGPYPYLSGLGYKMFEEEAEGRKANPSPQGMALAAGRFVNALEKKRLIYRGEDGVQILQAGRVVLAQLEELERAQASIPETGGHEPG